MSNLTLAHAILAQAPVAAPVCHPMPPSDGLGLPLWLRATVWGLDNTLGRLPNGPATIKLAHEAVDSMDDFLSGAPVDTLGARNARALYDLGSKRAGIAADAGATCSHRMGATWRGPAATVAETRMGEWTGVGDAAQGVLRSMAQTTEAAASSFQCGAKAAHDAVESRKGNLEIPPPSPGAALWAGVSHAVAQGPGGSVEQAKAVYLAQLRGWANAIVAALLDMIRAMVADSRPFITAGTTHLGTLTRLASICERAAAALATGKDPGDDQLPQPHRRGQFAGAAMSGPGHRAIDGQLASMIGNWEDPSYSSGEFSRLGDSELRALGLDPHLYNHERGNGFEAALYRRADGGLVVLFRGTNPQQAADIVEDAIGAMTFSHQSRCVEDIVEDLRRSHRLDNAVFAGHSLGGRLASVAAASSGHPAVTFNAAGVSDPTLGYYAGRTGTSIEGYQRTLTHDVRAYRVGDDLLTNAQERMPQTRDTMPDAVGTKHDLPAKPGNPTTITDLTDTSALGAQVEAHLIPGYVRGYDARYGTDIKQGRFEERP